MFLCRISATAFLFPKPALVGFVVSPGCATFVPHVPQSQIDCQVGSNASANESEINAKRVRRTGDYKERGVPEKEATDLGV